jgi:hypothetical protein
MSGFGFNEHYLYYIRRRRNGGNDCGFAGRYCYQLDFSDGDHQRLSDGLRRIDLHDYAHGRLRNGNGHGQDYGNGQ